MAKEKPLFARLIFIDKEIRSNSYPNCNTIAKKYEVTPRTIQRDIEHLKDMHDAPIEYDKSKRGYFYSEPNYYLPAINIAESDFFSICIAEKALVQYENTQIYDKLKQVFEKIKLYLPEEITVNTSWIDTHITFLEDSHTMINPEAWEKISLGFRSQKQLKIIHKKTGGEPGSRFVDPYHIVNYRGEWYLVGFCHKRKAVLRFAISRISSVEVTGNSYEIPADFDFKTYMGPSFGIMSDIKEFDVKIWFSSSQAPYIEERTWHPEQKINKNDDGSIVLSFKTNSEFEIKRWVLSWGCNAKILSPESLAKTVEEELRCALGLYESVF